MLIVVAKLLYLLQKMKEMLYEAQEAVPTAEGRLRLIHVVTKANTGCNEG